MRLPHRVIQTVKYELSAQNIQTNKIMGLHLTGQTVPQPWIIEPQNLKSNAENAKFLVFFSASFAPLR